jgi:predicted Zn-dependent protease
MSTLGHETSTSRPDPDHIQELLATALAASSADEAQARWTWRRGTATRFGDNAITQNSAGESAEVVVEVAFGMRKGSATTNRVDADALRAVVARAEDIARAAPEDPEHVPWPGPQDYGERPRSWFEDTAALSPEAIADDVATVANAARAAGLVASGLFDVQASASAHANSRGLFGWQDATRVDYSTTLRGAAGSGKAAATESARARIDVAALAAEAVETAAAAQNPVAIEPGDWTVIFEPLAVRGLLGMALWTMGARDAAEGSSAFAGTLGTKLFADGIDLALRTDDPVLPAPRFGVDGLAVHATPWVENGVVRRLHHDRYWAREQGVAPDAARGPLFVAGDETQTVDDLVAGCERGLLVKNLWYIRFVDPKTLTLTGMTRDGVFLVEDGRIVRPVKNLRWNESPLVFLANAEARSSAVRVGGWSDMRVPAIRSAGFTFSSVTDSI